MYAFSKYSILPCFLQRSSKSNLRFSRYSLYSLLYLKKRTFEHETSGDIKVYFPSLRWLYCFFRVDLTHEQEVQVRLVKICIST